jgi:hypothetical protein
MENSINIWQWHRSRKNIFTIRKIHSLEDGYSSVVKIDSLEDESSTNIIHKEKKCINDSPIHKYFKTSKGNPLKSKAYCRSMCLPIQNSIVEVSPLENGDSI